MNPSYDPYTPAPTAPAARGSRLPDKSTLEYAKLAIELLLLLLAIPWLVKRLFTHPGQLSRQAARKHVGS